MRTSTRGISRPFSATNISTRRELGASLSMYSFTTASSVGPVGPVDLRRRAGFAEAHADVTPRGASREELRPAEDRSVGRRGGRLPQHAYEGRPRITDLQSARKLAGTRIARRVEQAAARAKATIQRDRRVPRRELDPLEL